MTVFCVGHPEEVENSMNNMKRLFYFDWVGGMEEYVGCEINHENSSFKFSQQVMRRFSRINFRCLTMCQLLPENLARHG